VGDCSEQAGLQQTSLTHSSAVLEVIKSEQPGIHSPALHSTTHHCTAQHCNGAVMESWSCMELYGAVWSCMELCGAELYGAAWSEWSGVDGSCGQQQRSTSIQLPSFCSSSSLLSSHLLSPLLQLLTGAHSRVLTQ
jgi:hypothetical protein